MTPNDPSRFERWLKIAGVAVALVGLLAGAYQFSRNQAVEAARPFLERKLKWCEETVEIASGIAVEGREATLPAVGGHAPVKRVDRFWALYWGVMGMVEDGDITKAMVAFGEGLRSGAADADASRALAIAHACRNEMARDWSPLWSR